MLLGGSLEVEQHYSIESRRYLLICVQDRFGHGDKTKPTSSPSTTTNNNFDERSASCSWMSLWDKIGQTTGSLSPQACNRIACLAFSIDLSICKCATHLKDLTRTARLRSIINAPLAKAS